MEKRGPWMRDYLHPQIADLLARLLQYGPMALRSSAGATMGRDAGMAARLQHAYPSEPSVGSGKLAPRFDDGSPQGEAMRFADQAQPYPGYDYQVFGDKGRWMNDSLPSVRTEASGRAAASDPHNLRESSNAIAAERGDPAPWQTTDPFVKHESALSDAGRALLGAESPPPPEPGYGAQPSLPQYPRIPSHWVPENNPAAFTLRGPRGIANRATFTGDSLASILAQIARTELKPSQRAYLEAMARQKFQRDDGAKVIEGPWRPSERD